MMDDIYTVYDIESEKFLSVSSDGDLFWADISELENILIYRISRKEINTIIDAVKGGNTVSISISLVDLLLKIKGHDIFVRVYDGGLDFTNSMLLDDLLNGCECYGVLFTV